MPKQELQRRHIWLVWLRTTMKKTEVISYRSYCVFFLSRAKLSPCYFKLKLSDGNFTQIMHLKPSQIIFLLSFALAYFKFQNSASDSSYILFWGCLLCLQKKDKADGTTPATKQGLRPKNVLYC